MSDEPQRDMRSESFKKFQRIAADCVSPLIEISDSGRPLCPIDITRVAERVQKALERVHYMGIDE